MYLLGGVQRRPQLTQKTVSKVERMRVFFQSPEFAAILFPRHRLYQFAAQCDEHAPEKVTVTQDYIRATLDTMKQLI